MSKSGAFVGKSDRSSSIGLYHVQRINNWGGGQLNEWQKGGTQGIRKKRPRVESLVKLHQEKRKRYRNKGRRRGTHP